MDKEARAKLLLFLGEWSGTPLAPKIQGQYLVLLAGFRDDDFAAGVKLWAQRHGPSSRKFPSPHELEQTVRECAAMRHRRDEQDALRRQSEADPDTRCDRAYQQAGIRMVMEALTTADAAGAMRRLHEQYPDRGWADRAQKIA